ncbi:MAG: hypothetical protein NC041_04810 [Bacteroides sp.]|nr:hypothetical protein [Prevotella sp.]MCM1407280.1 hypothetical protein [Treponema brennaborense]MCM1469768.1 hypothetical protein [Bacteroides sp.]
MANDNDIKRNITSEELEQYGVWVKKAPRDCNADSEEILPETFDVYPEDTLPKEQHVPQESADFSETDGISASQSADESAEILPEEIDINDFLSGTDSSAEAGASGASEEIDISSFLDEAESVNMDDFMVPDEKQEKTDEIADEPPLDIDLAFDDSFSKNTEADPVENVETDIAEELSIDSSFDNFDDMFDNIKDESIVDEAAADETAKSVPEIDESAIIDDTLIPSASGTVRDMQMDDATEFDDLLNSLSDDAPADSGKNNRAESLQAKAAREYTLNVSADDESAFSAKHDDTEDSAEIENIALFDKDSKDSLEKQQNQDYNMSSPAVGVATEEELSELDALIDAAVSEDAPAEKKTDIPQEKSMDDMTQLLFDKIMNEISALRNEFSTLRNDVEELKQSEDAVQEPAAESVQPQEEQTGGFFSDETEDETIALSGDELDDILNSADFTEEASFAAAADEESAQEQEEIQENPIADIDAETAFEEADSSLPEEENGAEQPEILSAGEETEETGETSEYDSFAESADTQPEPFPFDFETENLEEPIIDDIQFALDDQEANESFDENIPADLSESVNLEEEADAPETADAEPADILDDAEDVSAEADDISIPDEAADAADAAEESAEDLSAEEPTEAVFSGSQWNEASDEQEVSDIELSEAGGESGELEISAEEAFPEAAEFDTETEEETPAQEQADEIVPDFDNGTAAEENPDSDPAETEPQPEAQETEQISEQEQIPAEEQNITATMKEEIKNVLSYMDQLLENLPEEKIEEFARSEHFEVYKKLFNELGLS